ncbi:MAG: hypothetical protein M0Z77_10410 [Thermoplasmatales archaeon]|jgi:hypothetical protein|nr:hypothetical protein [Candidatus Thermoplasmatota archaeon]MCL6003361.1 hypothetical protein [Candidatus Thermoplasmatota archaeon]MDA8056039.1 hypothetical protein [Thermoplasmatales archaeon]
MNRKIALSGVIILASLMLGSVAGAGIGNTPFVVYLTEPALHPAPQAFTYVGTSDDVGYFNMPVAPHYISYLQKSSGPITPESTVTVTFSIPVTAVFSGNPDGGDSGNSFVRIFFKAQLPEGQNGGSISGLNEYTYWWSNPVAYDFGDTTSQTTSPNGGSEGVSVSSNLITVTLTVTVDPAYWSDIYGHLGSLDSATEAGFSAALASATNIGLSFGSGSFFANGVGVSSGPVELTLNSFSVTSP